MKESVAIAKEVDSKKESSPTKSGNSIQRVRNVPERQLGSLRGVIDNIRRDGGTPSVESIATELSVMPYSDCASALLALQQTHGNQYVQRVVTGIQAKLKVGQPGDKYEQEADRMAEQVMNMPEPQVQRQPEEKESLQAKDLPNQTSKVGPTPKARFNSWLGDLNIREGQEHSVASDIVSRIKGQRGSGQSLDSKTRARMESSFGHDFSQVKIHTDTEAHKLTRYVGAKAFTTGKDIFFGKGFYDPASEAGETLLTHELIHVAQQSQTPTASPARITDSSEPAEVEADAIANGRTNRREISIGPRPEIAGAIARVPLPLLRHNWERVILFMQQAYEQTAETLSWRPGSTPQPPPRGPIYPLDQAEAFIRRDRDDPNFPSDVQNAVNQILRYIALIRSNTEVRLHGGIRSDYMLRLVEELETRSRSEEIFPGDSDWAQRWRDWWVPPRFLISQGAIYFRRWQESDDPVGSRGYGRSEEWFTDAYSEARGRHNEIQSEEDIRFAEPRARIFDIIRRLEQIIYRISEHRSSERPREDIMGRGYYRLAYPFWLRVYRALGGTETVIETGEIFLASNGQEASGT